MNLIRRVIISILCILIIIGVISHIKTKPTKRFFYQPTPKSIEIYDEVIINRFIKELDNCKLTKNPNGKQMIGYTYFATIHLTNGEKCIVDFGNDISVEGELYEVKDGEITVEWLEKFLDDSRSE